MIKGLHITLRGLELEDTKQIHSNINELELRTYLSMRTPFSFEFEQDFIRSTWKNAERGGVTFGIEIQASKELIGTVGLGQLWQFTGSAGLGIAIWEQQHRSKGFGTEAMRLLVFYAFEIMNMHRLQLEVYEFNHKAIKSYQKIGFKEVGRLRQATKIYNSYHDIITMDMLKNEINYGQELDEHLTKQYRSIVLDS